ncbi:MAG: phospho-sugar mutase [Eggerthellaceae bacterium]|jgi:phosphoglucomutase|nr:phospho-sugar mutase [Eggerthellaceae bacterium]MCH4220603.1 phospho-sugar mutase [Eggerthellaceae bacterium]
MDVKQELKHWMDRVDDPTIAQQLIDLSKSDKPSDVEDAFYRDLAFGTGGLRGIIGAGTNRMNLYTIGKATQGLANYLNDHYEHPSVAIAHDSRHNGDLFAKTAASVLAANHIKSYLYPRIEPTPALSFAVRDLHCSAGICVTASHNPSCYNGYKVYGDDGCQIATQSAEAIQSAINNVDVFDDVKHVDFKQAESNGTINWIAEDTLNRFIDAVYACSMSDPNAADTQLKLVYTPLNGTGLECVTRILDRIGIKDVTVVPEQKNPDGDFPTCPYPNPEKREALQKGIELCATVHPDLLLATDPDADRVGIAVEDEGSYVLLSGNEVGILLVNYIASIRQASHTLPDHAEVVSTIVSTAMIDALAKQYGFSVTRTLTGFKYIGSRIGVLESQGHNDRYIFGFEESYGYLSGTHVRDKDAVNASMLICQMAQYYKHQGLTLVQALKNLYETYGYYRNKTISCEFPGADGARAMDAIMCHLRSNPPTTIAGMSVEQIIDYKPGINGLPSANVVEFDLPDAHKLIVRPSGTEPKIKCYLFSKAPTARQADEEIGSLSRAAQDLLTVPENE